MKSSALIAVGLSFCASISAVPFGTIRPAQAQAHATAGNAGPRELVDLAAAALASTFRARRERLLLVNVWSTWCEPCVAELPALVALGRTHASRGLGLALISADLGSQRAAALAFLQGQGAPTPSYFKTGPDDAFIRSLDPTWTGTLPATLVLDEARQVRYFHEGRVDIQELTRRINRLLASHSNERGHSP